MTSLNRSNNYIYNYHHLISKLSDEDIKLILEKNFKKDNKNKDKKISVQKILKFFKIDTCLSLKKHSNKS